VGALLVFSSELIIFVVGPILVLLPRVKRLSPYSLLKVIISPG